VNDADEVLVLRREVAELKAALAEAQGRRPPREEQSVQRATQTEYELVILAGALPSRIDPRDTVARALFGEAIANVCFRIYKSPGFQVYSAISAVASAPGVVLGVSGIYSVLGWAPLSILPTALLLISVLNSKMIRLVMGTFAFVSLALLTTFIVGVWLYVVSFDPPRVLSILTVGYTFFYCLVSDSRLPVKNKHSAVARMSFLGIVASGWVFIVLFCEL